MLKLCMYVCLQFAIEHENEHEHEHANRIVNNYVITQHKVENKQHYGEHCLKNVKAMQSFYYRDHDKPLYLLSFY